MFRLALLICVLNAPLYAVSTGNGSPLSLTDLSVTIDLSTGESGIRAKITCTATLHNPGDRTHTAGITLPGDIAPEDQRAGYAITVDGIETEPAAAWDIPFEPDQKHEITWRYTLIPTDLPYVHPLGRRAVRVRLAHMRGYTELPETMSVTVAPGGLAPDLFRHDAMNFTVPIQDHVNDYTYDWYAETYDTRLASLIAVRGAFTETQRTHLNRSYTETLVHLVDLYAFKGDQTHLAETCQTLAALEAAGGAVITHCGPWAAWRKHIPWQLRRMAALANDKDAATAAVQSMAALWREYVKASAETRPFTHFDRSKYGNYWDYDWDRTRELYALALEVTGDAATARSVRETE